MKLELLEKLSCCYDNSSLELQSDVDLKGEINAGRLVCPTCKNAFPIIDGIPRVFQSEMSDIVKSTVENFEFEWKSFSGYFDFNNDEFIDLIKPFFDQSYLKGKSVLDAGCGSGMYSRFFGVYGATDVTLLDLSGAIEVAKQNIKDPRYEFIQGDIINAPLKESTFDFILSKGVIHHLSDPYKGFCKLFSLLKDGGAILFWVYGKENNNLLAKYSDIVRRRFFSKLPLKTKKTIAWSVTVALFSLLRGVYKPAGNLNLNFLKNLLPNFELFYQQSFYPFRHIYFGCYDHLSPTIAFYYTKQDMELWMKNSNITDYKIVNRWNMSWSVFAKKARTRVAGN